MSEILDLLGQQGTSSHPGILVIEDTQVTVLLRVQSNLQIGKLHFMGRPSGTHCCGHCKTTTAIAT